jgi:RNA polymerase sigma-70 factor (ECF subfamily)
MSSSAARYFPRAFGSLSSSEAKSIEAFQQLSDRFGDDLVASATNSDEVLMSLICQGDAESLSCLFRRYARLVRSVAFKILRDQSEADDLVQEVFILIHKKAASFDCSKASARSWILQMTYHRAFNRRRYLSRRHFYAQVNFDDIDPKLMDSRNAPERIDEFLDCPLKKAALQELMAGLSDNQQKTLRLYFFEGYTLEEIAVELGQTKNNVRHYYFRGLNQLRKEILPDRNGS